MVESEHSLLRASGFLQLFPTCDGIGRRILTPGLKATCLNLAMEREVLLVRHSQCVTLLPRGSAHMSIRAVMTPDLVCHWSQRWSRDIRNMQHCHAASAGVPWPVPKWQALLPHLLA